MYISRLKEASWQCHELGLKLMTDINADSEAERVTRPARTARGTRGKTLGKGKSFQYFRRRLTTPETSNRTRLARTWSAPRPSRSRHVGQMEAPMGKTETKHLGPGGFGSWTITRVFFPRWSHSQGCGRWIRDCAWYITEHHGLKTDQIDQRRSQPRRDRRDPQSGFTQGEALRVTCLALSDPVGFWTIRSAEADCGAVEALNSSEERPGCARLAVGDGSIFVCWWSSKWLRCCHRPPWGQDYPRCSTSHSPGGSAIRQGTAWGRAGPE